MGSDGGAADTGAGPGVTCAGVNGAAGAGAEGSDAPGVTCAGVKGAAGVGAGTIVCAMPAVTKTDASMTGSEQRRSIRFIIIKCILDLIPGFIIY